MWVRQGYHIGWIEVLSVRLLGMDRPNRQVVESLPLTDGHGAGTGGTLLGLTTNEGVLVAADTHTSRGDVVRSEDVQAIHQVHPTAVLGSTGDLGAVQSFIRTIRAEADRYETANDEPMEIPTLATVAVTKLRETTIPDATFLLGGVGDSPHVFTLSREKGILGDAYAAIGSGREVVYGVLDAEAPQSPTMSEARRLAGRAIESAAERDIRTGVGVQIAEISGDGVEMSRYDSVEELL